MKVYVIDYGNRTLHTFHGGAWTSRSFDAFQRGKRLPVFAFIRAIVEGGYVPTRYGEAQWLYTRGGV